MPCTTRELLDITSNHADGEEANTATLNTLQGKGEASRGPRQRDVFVL
jgi:hypothetical protein